MSGEGSASAEEVARFSAIAESWWDPWGKFKPLHKFNPIRLHILTRHLAAHFKRDLTKDRPFQGLHLLDAGCGGGLLAEPLARLGFTVTAIDASDRNIAVARIHADQENLAIDYRVASPEDLQNEEFDVVLAMEVVEHVADLDLFMRSLCKLAKPEGVVALATMNRTVKAFALAIIGAEYVLGWLPRGTHDWKKFLSPSELAAYLRDNRVDVVGTTGLTYRPLRDLWEETADLSVNYMIFGTKG